MSDSILLAIVTGSVTVLLAIISAASHIMGAVPALAEPAPLGRPGPRRAAAQSAAGTSEGSSSASAEPPGH